MVVGRRRVGHPGPLPRGHDHWRIGVAHVEEVGLHPAPTTAALALAHLVVAGSDEQGPALGQWVEVAHRAGHGDGAGPAGLGRVGHVDHVDLPAEQPSGDQDAALHEPDGGHRTVPVGQVLDGAGLRQVAVAVGAEDGEVDGHLRVLLPRGALGGHHRQRVGDLPEGELAHGGPVDDPRAGIGGGRGGGGTVLGSIGEPELVDGGLPRVEVETVAVDRVDPHL